MRILRSSANNFPKAILFGYKILHLCLFARLKFTLHRIFASICAAFPCSFSCIVHHAPTIFTGKSAQIKSKKHSGGNFLEPVFNDFALAG